MASFNSTIITEKGHALMSKIVAGTASPNFTKISVSDYQYPVGTDFEALTAMTSVKQTTLVSSVSKVNDAAVKVSGVLSNATLSTGYYLRAIGLYAMDPNEGEILYSITSAIQPDWIPPNNGISASSVMIDLITVVSNASNVSLEVDPNAVATIADIESLESEISDLQAYVGYTEDDIAGLEVDFVNKKFTRLANSINRLPGSDFDVINAFGGRKRCNVTDDGDVIAYHSDPGYSETGELTQSITIGETTYPVGTKVQVMVEQPKFYYKVASLQLDKVSDGKGFHMRKARYYVSDVKKSGFKLHPAFIHNGKEKNFIYLSAYEGSLYDVSASAYILDDAQIADFTASTGDKLSSIANAKPISGLTQNFTRSGSRTLANNRGTGWQQSYAATIAATQLLFAIEYASFNTQNAIGMGVMKTDDGATNMSEPTGATTLLGNASGSAANGSITYRGEENFWMNIWKWVDGLNIFNQSNLYVADHGFSDDTDAAPYTDAGITIAKANGYISAFAYNEEFDWLFFPSETIGNSSVPVGDYLYQTTSLNAWRVARLGGGWAGSSNGGGFCWGVSSSSGGRGRAIGGRLVYVPDAA